MIYLNHHKPAIQRHSFPGQVSPLPHSWSERLADSETTTATPLQFQPAGFQESFVDRPFIEHWLLHHLVGRL
jgi:hypothetical protein